LPIFDRLIYSKLLSVFSWAKTDND